MFEVSEYRAENWYIVRNILGKHRGVCTGENEGALHIIK